MYVNKTLSYRALRRGLVYIWNVVLDVCFDGEWSGGGGRKQSTVDVGQLTQHLLHRVHLTTVDRQHVHSGVH